MSAKPCAVLLFGPTAVGKTALLERLFADRAEVISADSVQVYRGLDIGSAKPCPGLRRTTPHHLIDILDPWQQYTAGDFVKAAEGLIRDIAGRGRIPVVSGGTAFYFRNLVYGLPPTPPADSLIRQSLEDDCRRLGLAEMFRRLQTLDPPSAARISPKDRYRILRALEVREASGKALSEMKVPGVPRTDMDFLIIGLRRGREELYSRINSRVDDMFRNGLVREIKNLLRRGLRETDPGMRGIGYREFFDLKRNGCLRIKDTAEQIKTDSRRYAKRQLTFFNTIPGVVWFHPDDETGIRRYIFPVMLV
jgi:tRNA dimethylallyltransferase